MDDDLIRKSPAAALESLREGHFGSRGGASDCSAPFLVPAGDGKNDAQNGALAHYYDLARHLSEDYQAGGNALKKDSGAKNAPAKATPAVSSCPPAAESPAPAPSPLFHSSRQLFSQIAKTGAENVSAKGLVPAPSGRENAGLPAGIVLHDAESPKVTGTLPRIGTIHALNVGDMTAKNENAPIRILSTTSGLSGSIRFTGGASSGNSSSNNRGDSDPRRDERTSTAGAMSVASGEGSSTVVTPGKLPAGPMQDISETLLAAMENMKREGDASATIPVALSDGSTLELRLRWKGGRLTASFGAGAEGFRGEIENGWGSLSRRAGNLGMTLEPPVFDGSENDAVSSFYA
jgi:hypothetical protein